MNMYKFLIKNNIDNTTRVIKGNNLSNALIKNNINNKIWTVITMIR